MGMKIKKLKKQLKVCQHDINFLVGQVAYLSDALSKHQCNCENYSAKKVEFKRFVPLPELYSKHEEAYEALRRAKNER